MVVKYGPHGKFLACPGFPECRNAKPLVTKNFSENKDTAALLRQAFRYGAVSAEIKPEKKKMKFKVKFGANIVAGMNKNE